MSISLKAAMGVAALAVATTAAAQVTFYSHEDFSGQQFSTDRTDATWIASASMTAHRPPASKAETGRCARTPDSSGRCVVLQPGEYPSLADMGLQNEISSVRPVEGRYGYNDNRGDRAYGGDRYVAQGYGQRGDERRTKRRSRRCTPLSVRPTSVAGSSGVSSTVT